MNSKEFKWESKDGNSMYGRSWIPEEYHTIICLVHGMGEHITRYGEMADYYNRSGIAIIGYDHRGHGKSDGKRGHADNIDQLLDDIQEFHDQNSGLFENKKSILYGHSLGGSLVLNFGLRRSHSFDGIISSAPFPDQKQNRANHKDGYNDRPFWRLPEKPLKHPPPPRTPPVALSRSPQQRHRSRHCLGNRNLPP